MPLMIRCEACEGTGSNPRLRFGGDALRPECLACGATGSVAVDEVLECADCRYMGFERPYMVCAGIRDDAAVWRCRHGHEWQAIYLGQV